MANSYRKWKRSALLCPKVVLACLFFVACASDPKPPALPLRSEPQQCFKDLGPGDEPPAMISASKCFLSTNDHELTPDAVPYSVNSALWTDGAEKHRYMVIPLEGQVQIDAKGIWQFPVGSLLIKEFGFLFDDSDESSRRVVETRFMQFTNHGWRYFSYRWREDGSDAERVKEAQTGNYVITRSGQPSEVAYAFPHEEACTYCHSDASGEVLGPTNLQLNGIVDYGHQRAPQIETLTNAGYVDPQTVPDKELLPELPDPHDTRLPVEARARSYLHANCAHCHQPGGWTSPDLRFDLRYTTSFEDMKLCNEASRSLTAYAYPTLLVPGAPNESALLARVNPKRQSERMPPVGVSVTDPLAVEVLSAWISSIEACP
ncbi:MAG: hypothetical protein H6714_03365 [Myxococcales bacterium]|nr:hypothetical protein [Myxococcales bacterium]